MYLALLSLFALKRASMVVVVVTWCCDPGLWLQTPLNRRKSAVPEMLLSVNDDDKEKENLRAQSDTPTAGFSNSFTPFKKMIDR